MTKYESSVKTIYAPVERVYAKLSDLENLRSLQERLSDPAFAEVIKAQAGDKVSDEQLAQLAERVKTLQFDHDSVSAPVEQLGTTMTLCIIEREENKLVKMELQGAPIQANLWIQMLPSSDGSSRLKLTLGADLNFFIKQMVGKKLREGVERFADMLCMIPY